MGDLSVDAGAALSQEQPPCERHDSGGIEAEGAEEAKGEAPTTTHAAEEPTLPAPAAGKRKDRRASLVIAQTGAQLSGLAEDAARGQALMAELEALLAASTSAAASVPQAPLFVSVAPVVVDDDGDDEVAAAEAPAAAPSPQRPRATALQRTQSLKAASPSPTTSFRRSSVITLGADAMFGPAAPAPAPPSKSSSHTFMSPSGAAGPRPIGQSSQRRASLAVMADLMAAAAEGGGALGGGAAASNEAHLARSTSRTLARQATAPQVQAAPGERRAPSSSNHSFVAASPSAVAAAAAGALAATPSRVTSGPAQTLGPPPACGSASFRRRSVTEVITPDVAARMGIAMPLSQPQASLLTGQRSAECADVAIAAALGAASLSGSSPRVASRQLTWQEEPGNGGEEGAVAKGSEEGEPAAAGEGAPAEPQAQPSPLLPPPQQSGSRFTSFVKSFFGGQSQALRPSKSNPRIITDSAAIEDSGPLTQAAASASATSASRGRAGGMGSPASATSPLTPTSLAGGSPFAAVLAQRANSQRSIKAALEPTRTASGTALRSVSSNSLLAPSGLGRR